MYYFSIYWQCIVTTSVSKNEQKCHKSTAEYGYEHLDCYSLIL